MSKVLQYTSKALKVLGVVLVFIMSAVVVSVITDTSLAIIEGSIENGKNVNGIALVHDEHKACIFRLSIGQK
jgi:hypothetical protein